MVSPRLPSRMTTMKAAAAAMERRQVSSYVQITARVRMKHGLRSAARCATQSASFSRTKRVLVLPLRPHPRPTTTETWRWRMRPCHICRNLLARNPGTMRRRKKERVQKQRMSSRSSRSSLTLRGSMAYRTCARCASSSTSLCVPRQRRPAHSAPHTRSISRNSSRNNTNTG